MDVHTFIKHIRDDKENEDFVDDIKSSINKSSTYMNSNLFLDLPDVPENAAQSRTAKFIHGNTFEDFVLKAAVGDNSKVFAVKNESDRTVRRRIKERKDKFKEIHEDDMKKEYENVMSRAGFCAWGMLSSFITNEKSNQVSEIKFEEVVENNHVSSKLKACLRADFVARTKGSVFLVDLKFSSMEVNAYEELYLVNGILQVLIYALLMGIEPCSIKLGVLVYYGREGMVILYTTAVRKNNECMKTLINIAGMNNHVAGNGTDEGIIQNVCELAWESTVKNQLNTPIKCRENSLNMSQKTESEERGRWSGIIDCEGEEEKGMSSQSRGMKRKDIDEQMHY